MRQKAIIILLMVLIVNGMVSAQDLKDHRWENRILLVYTENINSDLYSEQLNEFRVDKEGWDDRRMVLYSITSKSFSKGWENDKWVPVNDKKERFFSGEKDFEVVLLGLDGNEKLRQDKLLTRKKLYRTIDAMPMRQSELRNRGQ
ncbi:MAG TPA: DUF4174 domain-containing protein [Bacteroidales bacterium]|nr:DUF4174 domain-containing protein [Bacteroidales bacterium]